MTVTEAPNAPAPPPEGELGADDERSSFERWWTSLSRSQRVVAAVLAAILAFNVVLSALGSALGGSPGGPVSSSYSTGTAGLEAYADLARVTGHDVVRLKETPRPRGLPPEATVVLADPRRVSDDDFEALSRFLEDGGRLVLLGEGSAPLLQAASGAPVEWMAFAPSDVLEVEPAAAGGGAAEGGETLGSVSRLAGDEGGRWVGTDLLDVVLVDAEGEAVVVSTPVSNGSVVAVADSALLHNANLAEEDNAALALELIGGADRPVYFYESVHGFGATGVDALPASWKWTAAGLVVALFIGLWWAGSRLGPPEPQARALRPARLDHVRAVAADLERVSTSPVDLVGPLLDANRSELGERLGVPADAAPAVWARAAEAGGLDPAVVAAGTTSPTDVEGAFYVGALAAHHRQVVAEPAEPLSPTNRPGTVAGPQAP